jgi:tRNA (uracil-5-)-methyltransferase
MDATTALLTAPRTPTNQQVVILNFGKHITKGDARSRLVQKVGGELPGMTKFDKPYNFKEAYLEFASVEDEDEAIGRLRQANKEWQIFKSGKEYQRHKPSRKEKKNKKRRIESDEDKPTTIMDVVTPLAKLPYDKQLEHKEEALKKVVEDMFFSIRHAWETEKKDFTVPAYVKEISQEKDLPIDWQGIVASPVIDGYRNNCEFTCGYNKEDGPQVGFLEGSFVNGKTSVAAPYECKHISEVTFAVCRLMQELVEKTRDKFPCYSKVSQKGFWRLVKVRESSKGDVLVSIQVHPGYGSEATQDTYHNVIDIVKEHFEKATIPNAKIKGLNLQLFEGVSNAAPVDAKTIQLLGDEYMIEELSGRKFRVSPYSFFQVNKAGAELLYNIAMDWTLETSTEEDKPVLLDVCCGTGTIGIYMAEKVRRVLGFELSDSAVKDALENAKLNNVNNAEYFVGKAEVFMPQVMQRYEMMHSTSPIIAVVDPPRGGLHPKVVKTILRNPHIKRLVYVSCNAKTMANDALLLCKPPCLKFGDKCEPFTPKRAKCVDMFPHTDHCEMVVLFERDRGTVVKEETN